jgi:hypothetical protein
VPPQKKDPTPVLDEEEKKSEENESMDFVPDPDFLKKINMNMQ